MQKETRRNSAAGSTKPNPPRKLTRAEKKQIAEIIRQAKGDGKAHTAQQTIPYIQMYPDGICKVTGRKYSKTVAFEDINYQLAQADDKTAIFENWCDFLNYFDASVSVQLSFINQGTQQGEAEKAVNIPAQEDAFNSIRTEYRDMLKNQLAKGNNGLVKAKYITFAIEADSLGAAKSRLARIETDVLNNFKLLGVSARPMTGYERLKMLHGIFHPEGGQFAFDFSWLAPSGLSTKDFIAPSSFRFAQNLDCYWIYPSVHNEEEYGRYLVDELEEPELPEEAKKYFMYEEYGRDASINDDGMFTEKGYIYNNRNTFTEWYDGRDVPEEYRVTPQPPQPERPDPSKVEMDAAAPGQRTAQTAEQPQEPRPVIPIVLTSEKPAEKLKEITDRLEQGIAELFDSERYREYLKVMSKFHNYSFRNTVLIAMQKLCG